MSRLLGLVTVLLLGSSQNVGATSLAQDCSGISFLTAAIVVTGSALYDIGTAPASARRYNQQHVAIAPLLDLRHGSYGFSVSWSFGRSSRAGAVSYAVARRSPSTAFVLSLASTAGPMLTSVATGPDTGVGAGLFLGGLVIGPSVGHLYAGQVGRGVGTIALRGVATALGIYSIADCFID